MKITLPIFVVGFETDFGGVVSNTRYMEYLERGRYELLRAAGLTINEILDSQGVQPVVRRVTIDYLLPARHEDQLLLTTWVAEHTRATSTLRSEITRPADGATLIRAEQLLAYLNPNWKPVRVPAVYREALPCE